MTGKQRRSRRWAELPARQEGTKVAVLGLSAYYHDSAAALVVDGHIIAAAQEERFTRVKGDASFPRHAIEYVLREGSIQPHDLAAVVFYESPYEKLDRLLSTQLLGDIRSLPTFVTAMRTWLPEKLWVQRTINDELGCKPLVLFSDHHLSHAASAFYPSPFTKAAVLTVDGVGEWSTTTIATASGSVVEPLENIEFPNSLGLLYSAFTQYCGFKVNSGEYKLMGLAPFGEPRFQQTILDEVIHLAEDGSFALNPAYFSYFHGSKTTNGRFDSLFGGSSRNPEAPIEQRHADIAASIQAVTTKAMLGLARRAREKTGSKNLCVAGGVALNVVSIGEIERSGIFENIWVQPAAGDAGGALGAALWASAEYFKVPRVLRSGDSMSGAFLGPRPASSGVELEQLLTEYGLTSSKLNDGDLAAEIAAALESGQVVAMARGRMEFGPRALGARSVLADARSPQMQQRLNLKTKFREGFRPFAPIVLAEEAGKYFEMSSEQSPYMLKTYSVSEGIRTSPGADDPEADVFSRVRQVRSTIPAVTHVDYSARVQTVDPDRNPFLHQVLERFRQRTGCSVLVNTSFNVRGEPIVCTAVDAIECFLRTDIDMLVIDDRVIRRAGQSIAALLPRRAPQGGDD